MGAIEQNLARQAMRSGQKMPDRIANAPELNLGLQLYIEAFFDLDSERSHAQGPTPIPWTSIQSYAEAWDFDDEQTEDLFYLIKKLDTFNLKRISDKMSTK